MYALAILGTCEGKRDYPTYMKAAAIAEEVFAKNPLHPGAVHYLIHSYDDPVHAPLGMRAARVYAKIAPAAGHALHMPSHIFFASGMWEEAAASNEAAWKASLDRADRKKLAPATPLTTTTTPFSGSSIPISSWAATAMPARRSRRWKRTRARAAPAARRCTSR